MTVATLTDAAAGWLLQTGPMVALLLGLVLIIRRPFAKAFGSGATYALWAIPAIRLIIPPSFMPTLTWPRALTPTGLRPDAEPTPTLIELHALETIPTVFAPLHPAFDWTTAIILVWLGVAAAILLRQLWIQARWSLALDRLTEPADGTLASDIERAAKTVGLKRVPDVRTSLQDFGPCVTGLIRPVVLLPTGFGTDYTPDQRHYALVHEFAHIRRRDLIASFGALVFQALNWPNPLVHWAVRLFRIDQEAACDAMVMRLTAASEHDRERYARTLLHAAKASPKSSPTH